MGQSRDKGVSAPGLRVLDLQVVRARTLLDGALALGNSLRETVIDNELVIDKQQRAVVGSGVEV